MYAFEERGRNVILMTGGLARIKGITEEGMALMMSHMVARCQKLSPAGSIGCGICHDIPACRDRMTCLQRPGG